ncbi:hypothetical protein [Kitasatospora sp. NPDC004272]
MTETTAAPPAPTRESLEAVAREFNGLRALYGPTVTREAATLLDAFCRAALDQGRTVLDDGHQHLAAAATETALAPYRGHRQDERTHAELQTLLDTLESALTATGLTLMPNHGSRSGHAVAPLPDGRLQGPGLSVSLHLNGGWDVCLNQPGASVLTVYAPVTEDGAREVAQVVHEVLTGQRRPDLTRR